jgi:hypothetical protein
MSQATLFGGKPKVAKTPEIDKAEVKEEIVVHEKEDGWTDPINRRALDEEKTKGVNYVHIQMMTRSNLTEGTQRWISTSSTSDNPHGMMGSCWGSGGGFELTPESVKKYFEEMMSNKLEAQKEPYKDFPEGKQEWEFEYHHSSDYYRLIPMNNHIVIMGDKLKVTLKELNFDFDKWYGEYMAIEENLADEEHEKKVLRIKAIMQEVSQLAKLGKLIKESIRAKLGEKERYGSKVGDNFPDKTLDPLVAQLKEMGIKVRALDSECLGIIKGFGKCCYSDHYINEAQDFDKVLW